VLRGRLLSSANDFICQQAEQLKQQILAYQAAALDLAENRMQSFMIDTGQTKETVTKANIKLLQDTIDQLYNRYAVLCGRCSGQNTIIARPVW
jgi:hypothetical protein